MAERADVGRAALLVLMALGLLWAPAPVSGQAAPPEAEVRAILFYSPGCPHCHDVMRDHLPALMQRHGEALRIVAVNVDTPQGQALYRAVATHFRLTRQQTGVPAMVVGEEILVGGWEIPSRLPGLVERGLADGGVDWPPISEVRSFLTLQGIAAGSSVVLEPWMTAGVAAPGGGEAVMELGVHAAGTPVAGVRSRFMNDPAGNTVAVFVLAGMLGILAFAVREVARPRRRLEDWPVWVVPALAAAGAGVALYLAFVEVTGTQAVCGPVGDCNTVQLSPYATLLGVPIGLIGLAGYVALAGVWAVARFGPATSRSAMTMAAWIMAVVGVLFSSYLTFLEPFVIGATCMWCVNSAIIMTLLLLATTPPAARLRRRPPRRSRRDTARSLEAAA